MLNRQRVLVALSGGVDSTVCVHLLKQQGYDVTGLVLKMSPAHEETVRAAEESAASLGVPLYVRDMSDLFQKQVIDYFAAEYMRGRTPNPCVVCNSLVKFKALADTADELGIKWIATGHYARVEQSGGETLLMRGVSPKRDQSYMLYRLGQPVLSRLLLPLAELEKDEVRAIAAGLGVSAADKPDSQENCFIPDNDYAGYIERHYGKSKGGVFISPEGKPCGRHAGILHYTVGQRKGLGIAFGVPMFVQKLCPETNQVVLGPDADLYTRRVRCRNLNWMAAPGLSGPTRVTAKIRYNHGGAEGTVRMLGEDLAECVFDQPVRAATPGQAMVFYQDRLVLGGGTICAE